jgi:predicted transcriptional regulator of viral defense system
VCALTDIMRRETRTPLDVAVAELAERQWGVVSLGQLRALGLGERGVQHRVRAGRLRRLYRGVYAVGHGVLGREGRWMAAVLACGEGAVLSHRSAASHWGLLSSAASLIDVTAPAGRHGRRGIRLHRSRSLDARDSTSHQGIAITSIARTLLDLAATVRADRLERALAQAERLQLYDHTAITDVIARANGHRGKGALTRATSREDPKWTRNELEAWFLNLVREAGLPEPMVNLSLAAPDHPRLIPDFCWPTHRLIVETDGWETHRTRAAFEADRRRDAALQADGWRVVRFTWHEPHTTIQRRLTALLTGG